MTYSDEEYNFLCVLLAAYRDSMRRHEGFEALAEHLDVLGRAVFRKEDLSTAMLKAIKKVLFVTLFIMDPDATDETNKGLRDLRQKALQRTIAMLKERERGE